MISMYFIKIKDYHISNSYLYFFVTFGWYTFFRKCNYKCIWNMKLSSNICLQYTIYLNASLTQSFDNGFHEIGCHNIYKIGCSIIACVASLHKKSMSYLAWLIFLCNLSSENTNLPFPMSSLYANITFYFFPISFGWLSNWFFQNTNIKLWYICVIANFFAIRNVKMISTLNSIRASETYFMVIEPKCKNKKEIEVTTNRYDNPT